MSFLARHRYVLVVALVLASIGLSGLVVRLARDPSPGPPLMISPALASEAPASATPPPPLAAAAPPAVAKSPVASKSPSKTPSASPSTTPKKSTTPKATTPKATKPKPASSIYARYNVQRGRQGLRGFAVVSNTGDGAGTWTMTLTFEPGVDISRASGATLSSGGNVATFRGGTVAPDRSAMFSFGGNVGRNASIRPVSCTVNGRSCSG